MALTIRFTIALFIMSSAANAAEFDDTIAPLLKARCVRCHGPNEPKGNLNLSTAAGLARGGESGAAVGGGLDKSLLWKRISTDEMPPDKPLPTEEREALRKWIAGGTAGLPAATQDSADHWAFRPLVNPRPPAVRDAGRIRTTIDRFVQAPLEKQGLTLGLDATPHALIRRVSFDLTGLPPTLDEIEQFLADGSSDAYERMVERYLASPRYGERWGKHWLDAAGYADSNGYFSADTDRPLAYRYRDYVIRSQNADKPFDRLIREQVAGDELAAFRPGQPTTAEAIELLEATHFLRNGQDGTDIGVQEPEAFEIDRRAALEAAVQVTASSLLGLTLHCARCHDHKFEPITQKEYYQFQAILFPAFNPQDWINPKDRTIYAYLPGEKEAWEENERRLQADLAQLRGEYKAWLADHREPAELLLSDKFEDDSWKTRWSATAPGDDHPSGQVALGGTAPHAARTVGGALQIIAGPGEAWLSTTAAFDWTPDAKDAWIQATFDLVDNKVGSGPAERIGYTLAAHDFDDTSKQQGGNLLIDGNPTTGTSIYLDYPGPDQKPIGLIGSEGYVPGRNYGVRVTNVGDGMFRLAHLVDGLPDGKTHDLTAADLPDGGFAFFFCVGRSYVVDDFRVERSLAEANDRRDVAELRKQIETRRQEYDERRKKLDAQRTPEPGRAIAWVSDKSARPPAVPLLTRGLYHLRGENVEAGVLKMLDDPEPVSRNATEDVPYSYRVPPASGDATTTGRRLALAEWLTREGGRPAALVARVHANRIWRQYFGRGIVATTDNLGQGGSPPTNPELLEHLAAELVAGGWSQKSLHRQIVCSSVYRQSSAPRPEGLAADPDNRLLWRWPVRRLEAEVIRDGMLAVSGELDPARFGPYVPTKQTPVGEVVVEESVAGARRRSVYLQQRRSQTLSLLKVFDSPAIATVCTTRPSSTVPLQSLALLNSDFAVARGEALAARLRAETAGLKSPDLIRHAWRLSIGRDPTPAEIALGIDFLAAQQSQYTGPTADAQALSDYCQMLLASNWFLYLE